MRFLVTVTAPDNDEAHERLSEIIGDFPLIAFMPVTKQIVKMWGEIKEHLVAMRKRINALHQSFSCRYDEFCSFVTRDDLENKVIGGKRIAEGLELDSESQGSGWHILEMPSRRYMDIEAHAAGEEVMAEFKAEMARGHVELRGGVQCEIFGGVDTVFYTFGTLFDRTFSFDFIADYALNEEPTLTIR